MLLHDRGVRSAIVLVLGPVLMLGIEYEGIRAAVRHRRRDVVEVQLLLRTALKTVDDGLNTSKPIVARKCVVDECLDQWAAALEI